MLRAIGALLGNCCPTTIARLVVAVVVDAVNRVFRRRPVTHIRQEIFKTAPAIANANPATAIAVISIACGIAASLDHAEPYRIDRMLCQTVSAQRFMTEASAGFSLARSQIGKQNHLDVAAVTTAPPMGAAIFAIAGDALERSQSSKTFAGDVDQSGHGPHYTTKWIDMLAEAGVAV